MAYNSIRPGQVWLDDEGKRIQAHGGGVITVDGTFFWYGENKERTIGVDDTWHWGVRCYSSKDLYNWHDEGIIIPPVTDDPSSPLCPTSMMDRPHILYNEGTGKYVAWLKIMGHPSYFAVLVADDVFGPYSLLDHRVRPNMLSVGDFDLDVDSETRRAYLFSQRPHTSIYTIELTDDYTDVQGNFTEHLLHVAPPESREAPAHFVRNGRHYLVTSGTTGYNPNPSQVAIADDWQGPYAVQGVLHPKDRSLTSFSSQISCVFKYPGENDLYIAIADRWVPGLEEREDFVCGDFYRSVAQKMGDIFNPDVPFVLSEEDKLAMRTNTSISDYVWLPLVFEGTRVRVDWLDEWRIEDHL